MLTRNSTLHAKSSPPAPGGRKPLAHPFGGFAANPHQPHSPFSSFILHPSSFRSGFTLTELLVVIGIIVVMLGMGVLAFNSLTGRRSTAMARNQVAAMLGKARAIALNDPGTLPVSYGVIFFRDPETERTAMAIARRDNVGGGDPDPHDNYKAWNIGVAYQPGDRVVAIVRDAVEGGAPGGTGGAATPVRFRCTAANVGADATRPPLVRPIGSVPPLNNGFWEEVLLGTTSFPDEPIELLPVGVSVQVMTDSGTISDRYVRTGGIFFDRKGQMDHLGFDIGMGTPVGLRMGLTGDFPFSGTHYSGVGVAVYDTGTFAAQHTEDDYDLQAFIPGVGHTRPSGTNEATEEIWIDENANLLTVNRYSGELTQVR